MIFFFILVQRIWVFIGAVRFTPMSSLAYYTTFNWRICRAL